ncbi:MAG: hypothetical protein OEY82_09220 [Gammaproteobacteria bacterium]|jgi:hypothetical protein|nr:hypothetical protein [Gammaproteobacteria bacterium]MDH5584032.1 hypothetical protein [Gammaproteobacteria bacterium]
METEQTEHDQESVRDWNPPWLAWYRRYLYFAMILSALSLPMIFLFRAGHGFAGALLDVVFTAFVLKSLKRLEETPIKILHMIVNGAMVLLVIIGLSGLVNQVPEMIQSLLTVLAIEYKTLLWFVSNGQYPIAAFVTVVVLALSSIYWLWQLYQFPPLCEDDRDSGN